ncbi:hypothetical protein [Streptomyces lavendulae]|uniref:hypothetical protein n=1 Tax=Streptomyces lavendulae TaxID=1914 RepID=UPI002553CB59|nr:hypothetical protein [Streptomyces lavendulae]
MLRAVGAALGAGALAWAPIGSGLSGAPARADSSAMKTVAEEGPGYAIEDFGYPTAEFDVNKNARTPVGESADEQGRDFTPKAGPACP